MRGGAGGPTETYAADGPVSAARPLAEEELARVQPRLSGQSERLDIDPLVVAVEPPRHRLGGQGAREQAKAVGDRPVLAEVRRVREADDQPRQELGAGIVPVDDPAEHVPQRGTRRRDRRLLREELL